MLNPEYVRDPRYVWFTVQLRNWHGLQWNEYHAVVVQWVNTGIFEE